MKKTDNDTNNVDSLIAKLEIERDKYQLIAELSDSALWEYDRKEKVLRQYRKLKGRYSDNDLTIPDYRNYILSKGWVHPEDIPIFEAYCDSMDRGDEFLQYELRALSDKDNYVWLRYQGAALKNHKGDSNLIMGKTINIDYEKKYHEELIQKTQIDSLTGLYNRATTKEKIDQCFEFDKFVEKEEVNSFIMIDIDNFKQVNDHFGHLLGDTLLETFAQVLAGLFDSTDVVGRIGGDEFIVLQKGMQEEGQYIKTAKQICAMSRKALKGFKGNHNITVSVGLAIFPKDGRDYDTIYHKADTALYIAKSKGKDQYAVYQPEMELVQQIGESEKIKHKSIKNIYEKNAPDLEKRLLNFAFDIVSEAKKSDTAIHDIFHEIGKFYDLSRITVYENELTNQESRISYEWLNVEVPSIRNTFTRNSETFQDKQEQVYDERGIFYFNDVTKANLCPELAHVYTIIKTKALVQCAIYDANVFVGTINFEDCVGARNWNETEINTLYTLCKLISSFIIQQRSKQELNNEIFFTQAMLNNQKLSNYAINEGTYELQYFSEYVENLFPNVKLGELCYKAIFGRETPCGACPLKGLDENNRRYSIEAYDEAADAWYSMTASTAEMNNGQKINLICSSDVTGFIDRVNSKDPLTGLFTWAKFEAEAMKLIAGSTNHQYAIIYTDFDKFKNINDEWGYSKGNEALAFYANQASKYLMPQELFGRVTADQFVMLLSYEDEDALLEKIRTNYFLIRDAFEIRFPKMNIVVISGIYFLTPEDKVLSIAIDKANFARKTIKGSHRSNYAIYDEALHLQITNEKLIENRMQDALNNNEFIVYMQPKIDLNTYKIIGAEALVRWRLPSGQLMGPMEFIPIFEKNGFIDELDFYVYEKAFQALQQWLYSGKKPLIVSINVSRNHLKDSNFLDRFYKLVEKYKLPTHLIELEITESMFFKETERLINIINNLRKSGFLISIDDFGSGYSSLNLLKTLPIDILNLDSRNT